jgi:hypothetical protein
MGLIQLDFLNNSILPIASGKNFGRINVQVRAIFWETEKKGNGRSQRLNA